ncbi:hypothetical protein [Aliamphritea spongicola]|nr:hypothetical protein [Aliamphritea spongicola]
MLKKITKTLQTSALALAVASAAVLPQLAQADAYPERPVSMVVSYSPGGATDFQARIVTMLAGNEDYLGQPMVILNKPGAGGKVGWDFFASKAKKNGYELAAYNVPHFIAQSIVLKPNTTSIIWSQLLTGG